MVKSGGNRPYVCSIVVALFLSIGATFVYPQQLPSTASQEFRKALNQFESQQYKAAAETLSELALRYTTNFDIQHLLAIVLDIQGKAKQANQHFRKAVELAPHSVQAHTNFGVNLSRLGKLEEAIRQFQTALRLDEKNVTANFNLGTIFFRQKEFERALPLLQRTYELQPGLYDNAYRLAFCYFALANHVNVQKVLTSLDAVPEGRAEYYLLLALNQKALGKEKAAEATLNKGRPLLSDILEASEDLVWLLFSHGMFREALPMLRKAVKRFPDSYTAAHNLALAEYRSGNLEAAREQAERALALRQTGETHLLLGHIYEALEDSLSAVEHYQHAVQLDPSEANLYALGQEFLSHGNWEVAQQVFERALKRFNDSWSLWLGLGAAFSGQTASGQNRIEECTAAFIRATEIAPSEPLGYQSLAGTFAGSSKHFERAVSRFESFYRRYPDDSRAKYYYALAAFRGAEKNDLPAGLQESAKLLEEIITEKGDFFEPHFLLGDIYFTQKRWSLAVPALESAAKLNPDHVEARYKFALALRRDGQTERARAEFEEYQKLKEKAESELTARLAKTRTFIVDLKKK